LPDFLAALTSTDGWSVQAAGALLMTETTMLQVDGMDHDESLVELQDGSQISVKTQLFTLTQPDGLSTVILRLLACMCRDDRSQRG
jgi:hypothetical protein